MKRKDTQMHRRSSFILAFGGLMAVLSVLSSAYAAIIYVNKDNSCPGAGTSASPYCSLQNAFDVAAAGDHIRIRKASTSYNQTATTKTSGAATSPITVEPDDPANPPILASVGSDGWSATFIVRHSYWIVQNLIFDGAGVDTLNPAVWVWSLSGSDQLGVKILNNTITNLGGSEAFQKSKVSLNVLPFGIRLDGIEQNGTLIKGNLFSGNRLVDISVGGQKNVIIEDNEFTALRCGLMTDNSVFAVNIKMGNWNQLAAANGPIIRNNRFHDPQPKGSCGLDANRGAGAIWADGYVNNGVATGNHIWNFDRPLMGNASDIGIHIEYYCFNWTVANNVINDFALDAIRHNPTGNGPASTYANNTVYNVGRYGIGFWSPNAVVINNIFDNARSAQVIVDSRVFTLPGTPPIFDYNDYWNTPDGANVGVWNGGSVRNFSSWKSACNCDAHSLNGDPLFVNPPSDFHLQTSSPAHGTGGGGVDMGALMPPTNVGAIQIVP